MSFFGNLPSIPGLPSLPGLGGGGGGGNSGTDNSTAGPFGAGSRSGILNKEQTNQSSSESSTTTVGASDRSTAVSLTGGGTVNVLDENAIGSAFDFSQFVLSRALDSLDKGFNENVGVLGAALEKQTLDSGQRVQETVTSFTHALMWGLAALVGGYALVTYFKTT